MLFWLALQLPSEWCKLTTDVNQNLQYAGFKYSTIYSCWCLRPGRAVQWPRSISQTPGLLSSRLWNAQASRQNPDFGMLKRSMPAVRPDDVRIFLVLTVMVPSPMRVRWLRSQCPGNRRGQSKLTLAERGVEKGSALTGNGFAVRFCRTYYIQFMCSLVTMSQHFFGSFQAIWNAVIFLVLPRLCGAPRGPEHHQLVMSSLHLAGIFQGTFWVRHQCFRDIRRLVFLGVWICFGETMLWGTTNRRQAQQRLMGPDPCT